MLCTRNILVYFVSFIAIFAKNIKVTWFAKASAKNTTTQFHLNSKAPFNRCAFFPFLFMVMVCVCMCIVLYKGGGREWEGSSFFSLFLVIHLSLFVWHDCWYWAPQCVHQDKIKWGKKTLEKQTATGSLYKSV